MKLFCCFFVSCFVLFSTQLISQDSLSFENIIILDTHAVESQGKTGTCWSYATISFIESELIRTGQGKHDLSEMFIARQVYIEKANNFFRRHGKTNFGEGSLSHDLINAVDKYGIVPNEAFTGLKNNSTKHDHSELSSLLESYMKTIVKQKNPSILWIEGYSAILDVYLGEVPSSFEVGKKQYNPFTFAKYLNFNAHDYINLTSFNHHPFYDNFILEVPDNWSNGLFYNLPIDELFVITKQALSNGFTISWDTDVSNDDFDAKKGIASCPGEVTQEMRQLHFDNYTVTDDHLMHIVGIVKGSDGNDYFLVKNSWGVNIGMEQYKGYVLVSENYFKLNTISIMLHTDGVSKKILKKLNYKN